jgi:hypothetical protein
MIVKGSLITLCNNLNPIPSLCLSDVYVQVLPGARKYFGTHGHKVGDAGIQSCECRHEHNILRKVLFEEMTDIYSLKINFYPVFTRYPDQVYQNQ